MYPGWDSRTERGPYLKTKGLGIKYWFITTDVSAVSIDLFIVKVRLSKVGC